jgi:hypothetical protein
MSQCPHQILARYSADKARLTTLLREYATFNAYVEQFAQCDVFNTSMREAATAFREEVVELNFDLQTAFVENDDLIDRLLAKKEALKAAEVLVLEKANLISLYESRLKKGV